MNIIYLLSNNVGKSDGILKKVISQIDSWRKNGANVTAYCVTNCENKSVEIDGFKFFYVEPGNVFRKYLSYLKVYRLIYADLKKSKVDLIYWRFEPFKFGMRQIFKRYKTVVEVNADIDKEYRFTKDLSLSLYLRFLNYRLLSAKYFKIIKGFVCVTYEIKDRMLSYYPFINNITVIPNSIDLNKYKMLRHFKTNELPVVTFMGTAGYEWHGVDELIEFGNEMKGLLHVNVIGYEDPIGTIRNENVKFHGHLNKEDYLKIFEQTDVAIGVLSLYKKGLNEACPLKVREYLAYGLPVIQTHEDTIFLNNNLKPSWFLVLPNQKESLLSNKQEVLEFCYKYSASRFAEPNILKLIDSNVVELERLSFLKKI